MSEMMEESLNVPLNSEFDPTTSSESSESVDAKTENTGRWTQEEHELFMKGLKLHNKQWKLIADMIKTRTVVQIRTHAQKYFQKLMKIKNGCDMNVETVDEPTLMNTIKPEVDPAGSPRQKRKQPVPKFPVQGGNSNNHGTTSHDNFVAACFTDEYLSGSSNFILGQPNAFNVLPGQVSTNKLMTMESNPGVANPSLYASVSAYGNFCIGQLPNSVMSSVNVPTAKRIGIDIPSFHAGSSDATNSPRSRSGSVGGAASPSRTKRKNQQGRNRSASCAALGEDGTPLTSNSEFVTGPTRPRSKSASSRSAKASNLLGTSSQDCNVDMSGLPNIDLDLDNGEFGLGQDFPIDWLDNVVSGVSHNNLTGSHNASSPVPGTIGYSNSNQYMQSNAPINYNQVYPQHVSGNYHNGFQHDMYGYQSTTLPFPETALSPSMPSHSSPYQQSTMSNTANAAMYNAYPSKAVDYQQVSNSGSFYQHQSDSFQHGSPIPTGEPHDLEILAMDLAAWLAVDIDSVDEAEAKASTGTVTPALLNGINDISVTGNLGHADFSPSSASSISTPSPLHNPQHRFPTFQLQQPVMTGQGSTPSPNNSPRNFFKEPPTLLSDPFSDEADLQGDDDAGLSSSNMTTKSKKSPNSSNLLQSSYSTRRKITNAV